MRSVKEKEKAAFKMKKQRLQKLGIFIETDITEKSIVIGKGRRKLTLTKMQAITMVKELNRQILLLSDK